MKSLRFALGATALFLSTSINAGIITAGYSDGTTIINDGDVWTYIFDEGSGSNDKYNSDGLSFQNGSSATLNVTGSGTVRQDLKPIHGGLGVDGGDTGDNLSTDEWLKFSLGGLSFDLIGISLKNGYGNGHQDIFDDSPKRGRRCDAVRVTTANGDGSDGWCAKNQDEIGGSLTQYADYEYDDAWASIFDDITYFDIEEWGGKWQFSGYVESVTLRINDVPEPSIIALFGLGLLGLGFARRRKVQS
jgi:hypothetical protein